MGLVETIIPRPTQPHTAHTLRECPFNACSSGILLAKLRRLLFLSSRLQGRMRRLRTQMQHPTGRLGPRTVAAHGTASAHLLSAKTTSRRSPARLQRELWCPCGQVARLSWPIELEVCHIEAFACFGLPTVIRQGWTQQSDPILFLTADQQIGIDVARIHDLLFWQQLVLGQVLLNEG